MNISKADILNPDSDNAAVKLALAETHVIQETKTYLASHGVDLQTLTARGPRSDTALLVKNIPYGTGADGVRELFEPHGLLGRVLVPPAGTIAIVEFVRADEAAAAFRAVAYRRLGNAVVYLEKAPAGILSGAPVSAEPAPAAAAAAEGNEGALAEEDIPLSAGSTLFVKNLSFATASDRLAQAFRHLPGFAFARVQTRPDPRDPASSARVSAGYGFAGFRDADTANRALKGMQGYVLDGHALAIKFAGRGAEEESGKGGAEGRAKARSTKMIVKNVPFEATKKDIRDLFGFALLPLPFSLVCANAVTQCARATQVRPRPQEVRPSLARFCIPRVPYSPGGRERVRGAQAHASPRAASGSRMGGRGRAGPRRLAAEGWRWVWWRQGVAREEEEAADGWRG